MLADATLTVTGPDTFLLILAVLLFFAAAITAWFVPARPVWAVCVAAGLLFWVLTYLIH